MSAFGRIPDVEKTMTADIKKPGKSTLVLVGELSEGMGGSAYYDISGGQSGTVPQVDGAKLRKNLKAIHGLIKDSVIESCHDVSEGGLAVAITEMCIGGQCGVKIDTDKLAPEFIFNETAGCFVVEISNDQDLDVFGDTPHTVLGVTKNDLAISFESDESAFEVKIEEAKRAWQQPTKELF
jgi:phosphoribosylformylglycinamidine synthase